MEYALQLTILKIWIKKKGFRYDRKPFGYRMLKLVTA